MYCARRLVRIGGIRDRAAAAANCKPQDTVPAPLQFLNLAPNECVADLGVLGRQVCQPKLAPARAVGCRLRRAHHGFDASATWCALTIGSALVLYSISRVRRPSMRLHQYRNTPWSCANLPRTQYCAYSDPSAGEAPSASR